LRYVFLKPGLRVVTANSV